MLFTPNCAIVSLERSTAGGNSSLSSDADLTREGRDRSNSCRNSGSQRAPCGLDIRTGS